MSITPTFEYKSLSGTSAADSLVSTNEDLSRTIFINDTSVPATTNSKLFVYIYEDSAFGNWITAINTRGDLTDLEKIIIDEYSSYTLRIFCDITVIGGLDNTNSKTSSGCCLRDMEPTSQGGGYCMLKDSAQTGIDTFFLTEANFVAVTADPYDMTTLTVPDNLYEGINKFYVNSATTVTDEYDSATTDNPQFWTGYKLQPWPAAAYSEKYRFEEGDKAMGYVYNYAATGKARWTDEEATLKGAMSGISYSTAAQATALLVAYLIF